MCFRVKLHNTINSSVPTLPRISKPGHHAFDLREYIVPTYLSRDTTCANLSFQTIAEETCDCDDSLDYLNCM